MLVVKVVGYIQRNHLKLTVISVICDQLISEKKNTIYIIFISLVLTLKCKQYMSEESFVYTLVI